MLTYLNKITSLNSSESENAKCQPLTWPQLRGLKYRYSLIKYWHCWRLCSLEMEAEVIQTFLTNAYICTLKIAHIIINEFQTASVWTSTTSGFLFFGTEAA